MENFIENLDQIYDMLKREKNKTENYECNEKVCEKCQKETIIHSEDYLVCKECGYMPTMWTKYKEGKYEENPESIEYIIHAKNNKNFVTKKPHIYINSYNPKYKKIQMWDKKNYSEKSLLDTESKINDYCDKWFWKIGKKISVSVKHNWILFYDILLSNKIVRENDKEKIKLIIRGRNKTSVIAACLYYGSLYEPKKTEVLQIRELAELFNLKVNNITKGCKIFKNILLTNNVKKKNQEITNNVKNIYSSLEEFVLNNIKKFDKNINDNHDKIMEIVEIVDKYNICWDHTPQSIAATIILFFSNLNNMNLNKKDIAYNFNISDVTIIKTYKEMLLKYDFIINNFVKNEKKSFEVLKKKKQ